MSCHVNNVRQSGCQAGKCKVPDTPGDRRIYVDSRGPWKAVSHGVKGLEKVWFPDFCYFGGRSVGWWWEVQYNSYQISESGPANVGACGGGCVEHYFNLPLDPSHHGFLFWGLVWLWLWR
jgi:hypothetical protein